MDIQRIGRYDIKSLIGQGGMSAVYLGYDPRSQREVAIKILPPYYLHAPKFRERFEREALMIALLEHPAIVPVYDMGEEDGQPYIVMRYMSGGSLSGKLKKGPIPLRDCMEMYLRLAPALDTAHARGVIHRDVKPDNLLFDKYDNVFLSDFGLARLRETIGFANISDGSVMGTPAYMSPEQIQGERELDGRSDIYSMGIVLYQMLCGSVPFSGTTAASVMMMHLVNPVPEIIEQNKTLPQGIQSVLDMALAKNPKDRYQTAGEFARAIQAVTTGVQRRPSSQPEVNPGRTPPPRRSTPIFPDEEPVTSNGNATAATSTPSPTQSSKTPLPAEDIAIEHPLEKPQPSQPSHPSLAKKRLLAIPWWGLLVGFIVIILVSLTLILRILGLFPFDSLTSSDKPNSNSQAQNSLITQIPGSVAPGNADKLAFVRSSEIWVSNLDGSHLAQLTSDGDKKANLRWSPDGQSIIYTSTNCLNQVGVLTAQVLTITCFRNVPSITTFDISPDGQQVALGLAGSDVYLLPYSQLYNLPQSSDTSDLLPLAQCSYFAPYHTRETLKGLNWSLVDNRLALLLSTLVNGILRDEVSVLDFSQCTASPQLVKEISPTYFLFTLSSYFDHPVISSLSWNKSDQILLNSHVNEDGFGNMQLLNLKENQSTALTPNGPCCYRDAHWSPDGNYLFYAYQPQAGGDISLYYTPSTELSQPIENMA
ncbi:MAG TPA: protein kinase, partial [Anaerolineales bacterium]|nr:protein kinase [Anaerolineales bacterium]